jgi:hypothetical protein
VIQKKIMKATMFWKMIRLQMNVFHAKPYDRNMHSTLYP